MDPAENNCFTSFKTTFYYNLCGVHGDRDISNGSIIVIVALFSKIISTECDENILHGLYVFSK